MKPKKEKEKRTHQRNYARRHGIMYKNKNNNNWSWLRGGGVGGEGFHSFGFFVFSFVSNYIKDHMHSMCLPNALIALHVLHEHSPSLS